MNNLNIKYCPGCLKEGYITYHSGCLKMLFDGKKINHILSFNSQQNDESVLEQFQENVKHISISGVQEKITLIQDKNALRLTKENERGTYILKPAPMNLKKRNQVPANEHLTMQIAKQVYKIPVAENAMIFFKDGSPAYLTKRFDIKADGKRWGKEDFASLSAKTAQNSGNDFKYNYSYEEIGKLIQKFVPAWRIEIEKFFVLVIFNFLFSNGDAHLKNFALLENANGDYQLSPAYDLLNTGIHIRDAVFALYGQLFPEEFRSDAYKRTGYPVHIDFVEFGKRIGIMERRMEKLIQPFLDNQPQMEGLINRSFLDDDCKSTYLLSYRTRKNYLNS